MGSFCKGLRDRVVVAVDSQGFSLRSVKGMRFRARAMRGMRAKGEGRPDMRVSCWASGVGVVDGMVRSGFGCV